MPTLWASPKRLGHTLGMKELGRSNKAEIKTMRQNRQLTKGLAMTHGTMLEQDFAQCVTESWSFKDDEEPMN